LQTIGLYNHRRQYYQDIYLALVTSGGEEEEEEESGPLKSEVKKSLMKTLYRITRLGPLLPHHNAIITFCRSQALPWHTPTPPFLPSPLEGFDCLHFRAALSCLFADLLYSLLMVEPYSTLNNPELLETSSTLCKLVDVVLVASMEEMTLDSLILRSLLWAGIVFAPARYMEG
jgi:hypothetical protein